MRATPLTIIDPSVKKRIVEFMALKSSAALAQVPPWKTYRDQFPVTENAIYLNHATVAPLSRRSAEAMQALADDVLRFGILHYDEWLNTYEALRVAAARLIGAHRDEIAIVKNTSEGISTVALGLEWRPGDKVVAFKEEFPANIWPWLRLEPKGVAIEWLSISDPLEKIDQACRGAKLLSISFVQYQSGLRANLKAIGEICKRRGCFFLVDAIQGLGAFPIDVEACHIDALASDGHKWMLGPEGCGILYIRKDRMDAVEPSELGWSNVASYNDFSSRDNTLRADAGRYEPGALNTIGCHGLRAAIELLLEIGIAQISPVVQALADRLAEGASAKGYLLQVARTAENGAGIVSLRKNELDTRLVVRQLKDRKILAVPRQGWVRLSPHFYLSMEEMDAAVAALP
jgi:cysteine desulfurase/selenocysteine lyase